jgi:hypothetical protein
MAEIEGKHTEFSLKVPVRPTKGLLKVISYVLRSGAPTKLMPLPVQSPDTPLPSLVVVTDVAATGRFTAGMPSPKLEKIQILSGSMALIGSKLNPTKDDVKKMTVRACVPSSETASKYHQSNVVAFMGKTRGPSAWLGQDVNCT